MFTGIDDMLHYYFILKSITPLWLRSGGRLIAAYPPQGAGKLQSLASGLPRDYNDIPHDFTLPMRYSMKKVIVMTGILATLVLALCLPGIAGAQDKSTTDALRKFQGSWVMTSAEMDGRKIGDEQVKKSRITFTGNKVELLTPHQHKEIIVAKVTKVDDIKKEMQWVRSSGPHSGITMTAKFEFQGPDSYIIIFNPKGDALPAAFTTTPGSGHIKHSWKRDKK